MIKNLKIETFISNYSYEVNDFYTNTKLDYISIDHCEAPVAAKKLLEENDHDYLAGYVALSYNDSDIFTEELVSEDLLLTWDDLIRLLTSPSEAVYTIVFLDNAAGDAIITNKAENYIIDFEDKTLAVQAVTIPKQDMLAAVEEHYKKFIVFCTSNKLPFAADSLFRSSLQQYNKLVKRP